MTDDLWTFLIDLDTLDVNRATYRHNGGGDSLTGLWLTRERWEDMGRPSRLEITPKPA
jgi:hypothetical protein